MLHSTTPVRVKDNIIKSMTVYNGTVRCLLCTVAFGMGMDCKGVTTVVNFGPSKNIEAYIQESGRCGRGGEKGKAVILFYGRMLQNVSKEMKNYVRLPDGACRRKYLLQFFDLNQEEMLMAQAFSRKHECCDLCAKLCTCVAGGCDAMNDLLVSNVPVRVSTLKRTVSPEQQELLKNKLIVLRKELVLPIFDKVAGCNGEILTPTVPIFLHTFSNFQINQILMQVDHLFSLEDIMSHVEIWKKEHALKVLLLLNEVFHDIDPLPEVHFDADADVEDLDDEDDWDGMMDISLDSIQSMDIDISSFDISHTESIGEDFPKIAEDVLQNI